MIIVTISALQILDPDSHVDVSAHMGGFIIGALFALTQYKIWVSQLLIWGGTAGIFNLPIKNKLICKWYNSIN